MKLLHLLCMMGVLAAALNAGVIYNNIDAASNGSDCIDRMCGYFIAPGNLYASFTTAEAGSLSNLQILLNADGASGTVQVALYADNAITPGAMIANLGWVSDTGLSKRTVAEVPLAVTPMLAADTRYWIGLSGTTSAEWYYSKDTSGVGIQGEYFSDPNGTFHNLQGAYQMMVTVGAPATVPEPMSAFLVVAGLGFLALGRRRRA
jgi:hypothetical protein